MRNQFYRPRRTLRERFYSFMYGRNGGDALGRALLVLYLALYVVQLFARSYILWGVMTALFVYTMFRMLSRNLPARQRENAWYWRIEQRVRGTLKLQRDRWRDRKTHVYHKCPACKKTLRLPRIKGKHTVSCPCCHHRFGMRV